MDISRTIMLALFLLSGCSTVETRSQKRLHLSEVNIGQKATVFYFWATQCPCVTRYQERIQTLASRYETEGIAFVAISSNSDDDEEKMRRVSQERKLTLAIFKDWRGALADELYARTTPTVVMVDAHGTTLFRGWLDNERFESEAGREPYLENAIKDLLAGKKVSTATSPIYGCRITKSLR